MNDLFLLILQTLPKSLKEAAAESDSPKPINKRPKIWHYHQPALLHSWPSLENFQTRYKKEESADLSVVPAGWPQAVADFAPPVGGEGGGRASVPGGQLQIIPAYNFIDP